MVHCAYMIDQGPFPGFARDKHPTFHDSQKEHATQKVARVKGPRKKERKGATNKMRTGNNKKKSPNFGLCACTKLKYCSILYVVLENLSFL